MSLNLETSLFSLGDLPSANLPSGLGERRILENNPEGHKTRSLCLSVDLLITEDGRGGEINRLKTVILKGA